MGELLSVNCMFGAGFLKEEGCGDFLGLADQLLKCSWFHFVSAKRRDWISKNFNASFNSEILQLQLGWEGHQKESWI